MGWYGLGAGIGAISDPAMAFRDHSSVRPHLELAFEPHTRIGGYDPAHGPQGKTTEQQQWNSAAANAVRFNAMLPDIRASFIEPPGEKVVFSDPLGQHWVVNNGGGRITQSFSRGQKAAAEFGILAADQVVWVRPQIRSKGAVFLEHGFSKSHIGAEGRLRQLTGIGAEIEKGKRRQCVRAGTRQPNGR